MALPSFTHRVLRILLGVIAGVGHGSIGASRRECYRDLCDAGKLGNRTALVGERYYITPRIQPSVAAADRSGAFKLGLKYSGNDPSLSARRSGTAEPENTLAMLNHVKRRHAVRPSTLGAAKGYDAGWVKTVAGMRRARHLGLEKIRQCFEMAAAAYNLVRMKNLLPS